MLKPAAYPTQRFLANTQVGSDNTQWYPLQYMRGLTQQVFISFRGRFKLSVHEAFLQSDIIFLISNPHQSLYFMKLIK